MELDRAKRLLAAAPAPGMDAFTRETGDIQLAVPIFHEDNDMLDIFLADSPLGDGYVRVCDYGMALMRLSYTYEISTQTRRDVFENILVNSGVRNDQGNLYLDAPIDALYQSILRFAGCVQKVCNMRYWNREAIQDAFYEDLGIYVRTDLADFAPQADYEPFEDAPIVRVDWSLTWNNRNLYLFGVRGNTKASSAALCLSEIKKSELQFIGIVVHSAMEDLGRRERFYLTRNADKQYPDFEAFKSDGVGDLKRIAGVA